MIACPAGYGMRRIAVLTAGDEETTSLTMFRNELARLA